MALTVRRALAGWTMIALVCPWLIVVVTVLHVALEHDHVMALRDEASVSIAWHGHHHPAGSPPHQHQAVPGTLQSWISAAGHVVAVIVPLVAGPSDWQLSGCVRTARRSPPSPPTASPPILRV